MAITAKDVAIAILDLPGTIVSGTLNLLFGTKAKVEKEKKEANKEDTAQTDQNKKNEQTNEEKVKGSKGLMGWIFKGIHSVFKEFTAFIANNKRIIAIAGWLSIATALAIGLTLFLWPAALTAVASFAIAGVSIAGMVGANAALQITVASLLGAAAISVITYFTGLTVGLGKWIKNCVSPNKEVTKTAEENKNPEELVKENPEEITEENKKAAEIANENAEEIAAESKKAAENAEEVAAETDIQYKSVTQASALGSLSSKDPIEQSVHPTEEKDAEILHFPAPLSTGKRASTEQQTTQANTPEEESLPTVRNSAP